jgi:hypothetical protein
MGLAKTLRQTSQNPPKLGWTLRLIDEFGAKGTYGKRLLIVPIDVMPQRWLRRRIRRNQPAACLSVVAPVVISSMSGPEGIFISRPIRMTGVGHWFVRTSS